MGETHPTAALDRRGFLKQACAIGAGGVSLAIPLGAGWAVFLHPLHRRSSSRDFLAVASLSAVPADGAPRKFPVIAPRRDAWNRLPPMPVGAVYLRRTGPESVQAFSVVCPHAGCFVDFRPDQNRFLCPCHNSTFSVNGQISDSRSPAPRGLDELEVQVRDGAVWVKYQSFRAGTPDKLPIT